MQKKIAFYGKGGIGKSTTAANVSAALAEEGSFAAGGYLPSVSRFYLREYGAKGANTHGICRVRGVSACLC